MLVEELAEAFHSSSSIVAGLGSTLRPLSHTGLQTRPTEFSLTWQGWVISILSAEPSSTIGLVLLRSRNYFQHVLCARFFATCLRLPS